jgi:orotate phosphoribosyltransferase-like protein
MNELQILPIIIVLIEIGQVIRRSRVPRIVSHGKIIGPNEVAVKKRTIVIIPDIIYTGSMFLPTVKAKNKIVGKNIP